MNGEFSNMVDNSTVDQLLSSKNEFYSRAHDLITSQKVFSDETSAVFKAWNKRDDSSDLKRMIDGTSTADGMTHTGRNCSSCC